MRCRAKLGTVLGAIVCGVLLGGCSAESKPAPPTPQAGNVAASTAAAQAHTDMAFEQIRRGEWEQAKLSLDRAVTADPMYGPAHNDLGLLHYHDGRNYEAAWEFERAGKLMPRRGEPLNNLGLVYDRVGRWADAETAYQAAADLDPQNPEFAGNLARVRIRRGERDAKTDELLRLVVMKDTRPTWAAWAQFNLLRPPTTQDAEK